MADAVVADEQGSKAIEWVRRRYKVDLDALASGSHRKSKA